MKTELLSIDQITREALKLCARKMGSELCIREDLEDAIKEVQGFRYVRPESDALV